MIMVHNLKEIVFQIIMPVSRHLNEYDSFCFFSNEVKWKSKLLNTLYEIGNILSFEYTIFTFET